MARAFIKGYMGAMKGESSRNYAELRRMSDDEFLPETLSTTNTESMATGSMERSTIPVVADGSRIFDAGKTTVFSEHYFLELCEESLLGAGSSAEVRICNEIHTGERFACKVISKKFLTPRLRQRILNESKIHKFLSGHPHVVKLQDVCEDEEYVYLIMEMCKGGSLLKMIHNEVAKKGSGLPEAKAAEIMTSLAEFLSFCHMRGVVHRDLKPENILLVEENPGNGFTIIKVADFGNAFQSIISDNPHTASRRNFLGSHGYIAPEMLRGERYGTPIDVWSAGVVLCNLLTGQMPFVPRDYQNLRENRAHLDFQINDNWAAVPAQAQHLIARMLSLDPATRITADEICDHHWIKKHAKKREAKARRAALGKKLWKFSGFDSSVLACFKPMSGGPEDPSRFHPRF